MDKCIGIISYFPNGSLRKVRKKEFDNLISILNTYFKLPIVIIAQNWTDKDKNITYDFPIILYSYPKPLGITKARIELRNRLLSLKQFDNFILVDDDINISCNNDSVSKYLKQIDSNPNKVGLFHGNHQLLMYISRYMLNIMDYDYIKDFEAARGEIWEDIAWAGAYKEVYPNKFFTFDSDININYISTERSQDSTWYNNSIDQSAVARKTRQIRADWVDKLRRENKWSLL